MEVKPGSLVWVSRPTDTLWLPGLVREVKGESVSVLIAPRMQGRLPAFCGDDDDRDADNETGYNMDDDDDMDEPGSSILPTTEIVSVPIKSLEIARKDACVGLEDLLALSSFSTPALINSLRVRYLLDDQIYTSIGPILVAINPYREIHNLYSPKRVSLISNLASTGQVLPPHVFSVAARSFESLVREQKSQSILISGESGAGKTETTKQILAYLTSLDSSNSQQASSSSSSVISSQIMSSNPILEAFGNARTIRNNNSSRFGKFIKICYDSSSRIAGAHITSYLLERSRVVHCSDGERNFHVFYYLVAGLAPPHRSKLGILSDNAGEFRILKRGRCLSIEGVDSKAEFSKLDKRYNFLFE